MCRSKTSGLCAGGVCGGVEQSGVGDGLAAGPRAREKDICTCHICTGPGGDTAPPLPVY